MQIVPETRYLIGDLRTGKITAYFGALSASWSDRLNTSETIDVSIDLQDKNLQNLDFLTLATPCKAFLGVAEGSKILAAGPIWRATYNRDQRTLDLSAKGMHSYFDHRHILPLLALTIAVTSFAIASGSKTVPNPALASSYSGLSLGTIAKRLVQQARLWTGGNVPIVFQADESGIHTRTYDGLDFKNLGETLTQISQVDNGPDINFQPRFTSDNLSVEWLFQTGTNAQPFIASASTHVWDLTVPKSPVSELTIDRDGSRIGSLAWVTGGRSTDQVLVARSYLSALVDAGFPLYEVLDTSHSTVDLQSTLNSYAQELVGIGRSPIDTWSFKVESRPTDELGNPAGPQIDQISVGDFSNMIVAPFDPVKQTGDPDIPGGTYRNRIIGLSGDRQNTQISVQCAPVQGA